MTEERAARPVEQPSLKDQPKISQIVKLEVIGGLKAGTTLEQVQHLLQHTQDHDGYLPIGEHIYLRACFKRVK